MQMRLKSEQCRHFFDSTYPCATLRSIDPAARKYARFSPAGRLFTGSSDSDLMSLFDVGLDRTAPRFDPQAKTIHYSGWL